MKSWIALALISPLLFGCTAAQIKAMDNAGGVGVLTSTADAFDGTHRVRLTPAHVKKPAGEQSLYWTAYYQVGAQWLSAAPDVVNVIVGVDGAYVGIRGIAFNVAGEQKKFDARGTTNFDSGLSAYVRESTQYVPMPLRDFIEVVKSDDVQARVYFTGGEYADADFSALTGRGGALTARHYLQSDFLPELIRAATLSR